MTITKKMIDDLFNIIALGLDAIAKVDPKAKTLTMKQILVDVMAKTFDSLKSDLEQYFLSGNNAAQAALEGIAQPNFALALDKAKAIGTKGAAGSKTTFIDLWPVLQNIINLLADTATAELPKGSSALNAIITVTDALNAMGTQLAADLPKLAK